MIDGGITSMPGAYASAPAEAPVVIWVGKLEARKDPLAALDVAEELRLRIPRARLVMVGDGWLSDRIREEIRARSLTDCVQLVGRITHNAMTDVYTSASVFLFTSLRDTFGVQNLEAMTHGLPIVFRDSSGVAVGDFAGSAAVAVPNGEKWPVRAAQAVAELLRDGEDWRNRSLVAVSTARNLTWTAKVERAAALYRAAVTEMSATPSR
jgi:glycosyltransferase involved in cell wall biosynthesis